MLSKIFVISLFSKRANLFQRVCLFLNFCKKYDICTERDSVSGCTYGKKAQYLITAINFGLSEIEASGTKSLVPASFTYVYILFLSK